VEGESAPRIGIQSTKINVNVSRSKKTGRWIPQGGRCGKNRVAEKDPPNPKGGEQIDEETEGAQKKIQA